MVFRLYDAPPYRDPLAWWTAVAATVTAFAIASSPTTSGMPRWLNTALAVIVMTGLFAVLPAYLRLVVRRQMWRNRERRSTEDTTPPATTEETGPGRSGPRHDKPSPTATPTRVRTRKDPVPPNRPISHEPTTSDLPARPSNRELPYPIARALRAVGNAPTEKERYVAVLDAADAISVTVGVVAAAWLRAIEPDASVFGTLHEAYGRGVTQGTWQALIRAAAHEPSAGSDMPGLAQAAATTKKGNLLHHLGLLTEERNKWAHGAAPRTNAEASDRLTAMRSALDAAIARSTFLSATPWVVTQSCSFQVQDRTFDIQTAVAMGDHPEFARSAMTSSVPLADERVYVVRQGQQPIDLTPFVVWKHCSECRKPELFLVDRRAASGAVLKSFDGGHVMRDTDLAHELDGLGQG